MVLDGMKVRKSTFEGAQGHTVARVKKIHLNANVPFTHVLWGENTLSKEGAEHQRKAVIKRIWKVKKKVIRTHRTAPNRTLIKLAMGGMKLKYKALFLFLLTICWSFEGVFFALTLTSVGRSTRTRLNSWQGYKSALTSSKNNSSKN